MAQMVIDDLKIEVIHKKIKYLRISVHPPLGAVRLSVPLTVDAETVQQFLTKQLGWIKKKKLELSNTKWITPYQYKSLETHYYLGQPLTLQVVPEDDKKPLVFLEGTTLYLSAPHRSKLTERRKRLNDWYRAQMKALLPELILKWEAVVQESAKEWRLREMKTRWGSCNVRARKICLNTELMKRPLHCLDYVIVHELVHLIERSHNARFWSLMDQFLPNWRESKGALRREIH